MKCVCMHENTHTHSCYPCTCTHYHAFITSYICIFEHMPGLGFVGAPIATSITRCLQFASLLLYLLRSNSHKRYVWNMPIYLHAHRCICQHLRWWCNSTMSCQCKQTILWFFSFIMRNIQSACHGDSYIFLSDKGNAEEISWNIFTLTLRSSHCLVLRVRAPKHVFTALYTHKVKQSCFMTFRTWPAWRTSSLKRSNNLKFLELGATGGELNHIVD